jgi:AMMECR1 domain-containing protein
MSEAQTVSLTFEDGARAVELARDSIESYVLHGQREQPGSMREAFYQRTGAIVRIQSTRGQRSLRGCAGDIQSSAQLGHAIVDAAIEAASDGSCGSELRSPELDSVTVSTCVVCNLVLTDDPSSDLLSETAVEAEEARAEDRQPRTRALIWRGLQDSSFLNHPRDLRPGDTIVLPVS